MCKWNICELMKEMESTRYQNLHMEWNMLCRIFQICKEQGYPFWSDGDVLLFESEDDLRIVEAYFQDNFSGITTKSGYFDPEEDAASGETDEYTGFYYLDFE